MRQKKTRTRKKNHYDDTTSTRQTLKTHRQTRTRNTTHKTDDCKWNNDNDNNYNNSSGVDTHMVARTPIRARTNTHTHKHVHARVWRRSRSISRFALMAPSLPSVCVAAVRSWAFFSRSYNAFLVRRVNLSSSRQQPNSRGEPPTNRFSYLILTGPK